MDDKIDFISKNIELINDTDDIISYIYLNDINYSQNSNGYFLNLSLLDEKHIEEIYNLVKIKISQNIFEDKNEILKITNKKHVPMDKESIILDPDLEAILKSVFL